MTIASAHPGHHISTKSMALAVAGAGVAVVTGFGIAAVVLDDASPATGTNQGDTDIVGRDDDPGFDPNGFAGTDREERALMHRR